MMNLFREDVISKFDLYKYDLEEVVKYNMTIDESHEHMNE